MPLVLKIPVQWLLTFFDFFLPGLGNFWYLRGNLESKTAQILPGSIQPISREPNETSPVRGQLVKWVFTSWAMLLLLIRLQEIVKKYFNALY